MKTLLRIFFALCLLLILALGLGYFLVTRPSFQKDLIESRLPEGSSLKFVKLTPNRLQIEELKLKLPNGSNVRLETVSTSFSPLAAVFDKTIRMKALNVDGLVIELNESSSLDNSAGKISSGGLPEDSAPNQEAIEVSDPVEGGAPFDSLYALGQLEWLFDIESINIDGTLIDAQQNSYSVTVKSGPLLPGETTKIETVLNLKAKEALQGGLKNFTSKMTFLLAQSIDGGFEELALESDILGTDSSNAEIISITHDFALTIDSFNEQCTIKSDFNANLPRPELFAPELIALRGLSLKGSLDAIVEGSVLLLNEANLFASSQDVEVVSVDLKQRLTVGSKQNLSGELVDIRLTNMPLEWMNPWLSNGFYISGQPLSAQILLIGSADGALEARSAGPIELNTFSLSQSEQPLLEEITIRLNPVIVVDANQMVNYDLGDFQILDRYGKVISGTVQGSLFETESKHFLAGLKTSAKLDVGLAELFNQPILVEKGEVLAGRAQIAVDINGEAEYPAKLQSSITGLRARELPGTRQDYRFAAQLKQTKQGVLFLDTDFQAGSESRPSTALQLTGQISPDLEPIEFKFDLGADKITQSDIDLLIAAFVQKDPLVTEYEEKNTTPRDVPIQKSTEPSTVLATTPEWAGFNGELTLRITEFVLSSTQRVTNVSAKLLVTEPLLELSRLSASLGDGQFNGAGKLTFAPESVDTYQVSLGMSLKDLDPSIFSDGRSGSFPVKGLFDGNFTFEGAGLSLEEAIDQSEADLTLTGRDGVWTAFELDRYSKVALAGVSIGAGLFGDKLDRPGILALAEAIPYFKDIHFDEFVLKASRGDDQKVRIPEFSFLGESLRFKGQGFIAASTLREMLDQPIDLNLEFGAKGKLVDYLKTLDVLTGEAAEDGFYNWNQPVKIAGSLLDLDTDALSDLLNAAARNAFTEKPKKTEKVKKTEMPIETKAEAVETAVEAPESTKPKKEKKSKEQKVIEDIDMVLDLFNSVPGY